MQESEAREEIVALAAKISALRDAYYARDELLADDAQYDRLVTDLEALERQFPQFASDDSPTRNVGSGQPTLFSPLVHAERMYSLDNVFSDGEMLEWLAKIHAEYPNARFLCEPKIDGLAINLHYKNGQLMTAATRGDGTTGEDVSKNVQHIPGLPRVLSGHDHPTVVEVRGEVFFPV
ncbi:MAG: NAD-dependent DNA ligase LigA, partial [Pontimonas sp.]